MIKETIEPNPEPALDRIARALELIALSQAHRAVEKTYATKGLDGQFQDCSPNARAIREAKHKIARLTDELIKDMNKR